VPVTSIDTATGGIRVNWIAPYDNSDTITKYKIEGLLPDNTWAEFAVCDGSDPLIV
jgi:hypothetical protein